MKRENHFNQDITYGLFEIPGNINLRDLSKLCVGLQV